MKDEEGHGNPMLGCVLIVATAILFWGGVAWVAASFACAG
jgi:hypothetical protein